MYPSLLARMVYQVGSPAMFEGKRFFPETGTPIWNSVRSSTMFALCEPDPFTVATCRLMSLITGDAGWLMDLLVRDGARLQSHPGGQPGNGQMRLSGPQGVLDPGCGRMERTARAPDSVPPS